jgi:hypothetical protein
MDDELWMDDVNAVLEIACFYKSFDKLFIKLVLQEGDKFFNF